MGKTPPHDSTRDAIAQAAASLIAEGLTDYHAAKKKAARNLGLGTDAALPDNHEIEAALREHFALFSADTQPQALAALREVALDLMHDLAHFSPWISGAVLNGTANEYSEIELELIEIEAKEFELYLLNHGIEFELSEPHTPRHSNRAKSANRRGNAAPIVYQLEYEDAPVSIALYASHAARAAAHPQSSIKHDRAQLDEATRRFADAESAKL